MNLMNRRDFLKGSGSSIANEALRQLVRTAGLVGLAAIAGSTPQSERWPQAVNEKVSSARGRDDIQVHFTPRSMEQTFDYNGRRIRAMPNATATADALTELAQLFGEGNPERLINKMAVDLEVHPIEFRIPEEHEGNFPKGIGSLGVYSSGMFVNERFRPMSGSHLLELSHRVVGAVKNVQVDRSSFGSNLYYLQVVGEELAHYAWDAERPEVVNQAVEDVATRIGYDTVLTAGALSEGGVVGGLKAAVNGFLGVRRALGEEFPAFTKKVHDHDVFMRLPELLVENERLKGATIGMFDFEEV